MINRILFTILIVVLCGPAACTAEAASLLKTITRADEASHMQLTFQLDNAPVFATKTTGRKVDLELQDSILDDKLAFPTTDDRLIKIVNDQQKSKLTISFYFRYPPQNVTSESNKDTGTITLDILLGNQLSTAFPVPKKSGGKAANDPTSTENINPLSMSSYAKNWISFFSEYESPVKIKATPKLILPPFPLAAVIPASDDKWLPPEIAGLANEKKWSQVSLLLRKQITVEPSEHLKEHLLLSYAESLVRAGEYKEPYFLLQKIILGYPDTLLSSLAQFLLIYQQAARGNHVDAYYDLDLLLKKIEKETPFTPYFDLLLADLALLAGRTTDAEKYLDRDEVVGDERLQPLRLLRKADLLYAKNETAKALAAYSELASKSSIVDTDPMSLANYSDVLYINKRFPESAKKYRTLSDALNNAPFQDLALFRQAMAQLHVPATEKKARVDLQQVLDGFPRTEGYARALLKLTDLDYLTKRVNASATEAVYRKIAEKGEMIILREEAFFKQALVNALAGDHLASVNLCMEMLREFQSGKLRLETKALLIEQLPGAIKQLVKAKEYIKALVLAKQNKDYFNRGWLNPSILYDLANVYGNLGLVEQTAQTYQYLFEISSEAEKEKIYLPLIQNLASLNQHKQVEEYADRYLIRYPKGADGAAVFLFKIRSLYASGQLDTTLKLLQTSRYNLPQLDLIKAQIFFEKRQWQQVIDILGKLDSARAALQNNATFMLAESYYQTGKEDLAAAEFRRVAAQEGGSEQAQFRIAQIESKKGDAAQALKLFKELAEKGKDPLWTKLAREEVAISELQQK